MKKIGVLLVTVALTLGPATSVLAQKAPDKAQTQTKTPTQATCPVFGGKVDKNVYTDYKGQRIYFCCADCDKEFKKDPDKYLKKMESQGVTPEKSPATAGKKGK